MSYPRSSLIPPPVVVIGSGAAGMATALALAPLLSCWSRRIGTSCQGQPPGLRVGWRRLLVPETALKHTYEIPYGLDAKSIIGSVSVFLPRKAWTLYSRLCRRGCLLTARTMVVFLSPEKLPTLKPVSLKLEGIILAAALPNGSHTTYKHLPTLHFHLKLRQLTSRSWISLFRQ